MSMGRARTHSGVHMLLHGLGYSVYAIVGSALVASVLLGQYVLAVFTSAAI